MGPRALRPVQAALWGLRFGEFTAAARARFGETYTVRLGSMPASVVTVDRDLIRYVLSGEPLARASANEVTEPLVGLRSVLRLAPAEHLVRRKLLLPAFHGEAIADYRDLVTELVDEELARWRPGDVVVVLDVAQRITLEVIMRAVLGIEDAALRTQMRKAFDDLFGYPVVPSKRRLPGLDARPAAVGSGRGIATTIGALMSPAVLTYYPGFKRRRRWNVLTEPFHRYFDALMGLMDQQIAATRNDPDLAQRRDILAMLVQARDDEGAGLADEDLRQELFTLLSGGHETTAAAIAWGIDHLARNPDLRRQAAQAAASGDTGFMDAVVKETLRLSPPIPIGSQRRLDHDIQTGVSTIPAGTPILIDAHGLHRHPELYPDPLRFEPTRFIDHDPQPYSWLPFGGGSHRCIGVALATMEITTALTHTLQAVDFNTANDEPARVVRRGLVDFPSHGARIKIKAKRASFVSAA